MILTNNLGYPRIGRKRELKFALEAYWKKKSTLAELLQTAEEIQIENWKLQLSSGIDLIPSNDFSLYDHVLDTSVMLGAIPDRFFQEEFESEYDRYFAMARGYQTIDGQNMTAMEMTKWFNTNYHYIVPEINKSTQFSLNLEKPLAALNLASQIGITTKPVILGPVSFLLLSKSSDEGFKPMSKLPEILPLYQAIFSDFKSSGVEWVQLDEPWLALELEPEIVSAFKAFFDYFKADQPRPKIILTSYFADSSINLPLLNSSPFEGLHLDLTSFKDPMKIAGEIKTYNSLSLGLVDGRNIWRHDLDQKLALAREISQRAKPQNLLIASSCSMLHIPQDIEMENELDLEVKGWLSFASQKLLELSALKTALHGNQENPDLFHSNQSAITSRRKHDIQRKVFQNRQPASGSVQTSRESDFKIRRKVQQAELALPLLPTTTIGSFPQTSEVRKARADFDKGNLSPEDYDLFLKKKIRELVEIQDEIGLDVLVHGEFERNDMVQYFGEKLDGFAFTEHGWVQSFGSRYVRPPIIHSYVIRPAPMTVEWAQFAQSLTDKPMKGMLTGPVTILQWSFVRDDQPRSETCRQIAMAIREEVKDLETAGIRVIQIDEPALREGLPLHRKDWQDYLEWAVESFKITSCSVRDETQIHTHMCYSEFNDIIQAIADMDADVISIEASRSNMELLQAFEQFEYPNEIGPGVYDIHSPIIPSEELMKDLIKRALDVIPADQLWVNPDCGLKTRAWEEVMPALKNMVAAAQAARADLA
jgi:5-methyltetrahydropteroyltriglutamate--homocysteine methyltransferase